MGSGGPAVVLTYDYFGDDQRKQLDTRVAGVNQVTQAYLYDAAGRQSQLTQQNYAGGALGVSAKRANLSYNAAGQVDFATRYRDTTGTNVVATTDYVYSDPVGRLTAIQHAYGPANVNFTYGYDVADRITSWTRPGGSGAYGYDLSVQKIMSRSAASSLLSAAKTSSITALSAGRVKR